MITIEHLQKELDERKAQAEAAGKDIEQATEFLKQKQTEVIALSGAVQQLQALLEAAKAAAAKAPENTTEALAEPVA